MEIQTTNRIILTEKKFKCRIESE